MWTLVAILVAFLAGAALASVYHTRINSVVANLRHEKSVLQSQMTSWQNEATTLRLELNDLKRRIEGKVTEFGKKL